MEVVRALDSNISRQVVFREAQGNRQQKPTPLQWR